MPDLCRAFISLYLFKIYKIKVEGWQIAKSLNKNS
jgi:hypothetical protein